jgi:GntR family transcriptional regulator, histidine utilization repressor
VATSKRKVRHVKGGRRVIPRRPHASLQPLYEVVKKHILGKMRTGELSVGARIPSEHELVRALRMSRMTVHRALRELSAEGLLIRRQGLGTFVAPQRPRSELVEIRDFAEDVVARGHAHRLQIVVQEATRANPELALIFDVSVGSRLFHSTAVHFEDEVPVILEERYVRPQFAPKYLEQDFTKQSPGSYLYQIEPPTEIEHVVLASAVDSRTRQLLKVDRDDVCLILIRRTWVRGEPVTRSRFLMPGSRYTLGSRYTVRNASQ